MELFFLCRAVDPMMQTLSCNDRLRNRLWIDRSRLRTPPETGDCFISRSLSQETSQGPNVTSTLTDKMGSFTKVTAVLTLLAIVGGGRACDTDGMLRCVAKLSKYQGETSAVFKHYAKADLQDACKIFAETNFCIAHILNGCPTEVRMMWSGVEDTFQYICSAEGMAIYLEHGECWADAAVQQRGKLCNSTYQTQVASMKGKYQLGYSSLETFKSDICRSTNGYLQCIYKAVVDQCGLAAAEWQLRVTEKAVKPTASLIQCHLHGGSIRDGASGSIRGGSSGTIRDGT